MTSAFGSVRFRGGVAVAALWAGVLAWLWPIGLGGRMPVGGDVTQFSLGPMSFFSRSLRAGHLPLWNDLWGYGFPGVGESQMGVFYPPHWVLYGFLSPETAYTASLVAHALWGALGAYFAARRFGASEVGSALGAFAWSSCGFFLIHLSHQWAYTTGSWMPWAWGLAWSILGDRAHPREPFFLAVVLAVQLLPGHFQLAFCTEVGVFVLAAERAFEVVARRPRGLGRITGVVASVAGAFALAAIQLWPTYRLARLAAPRRDFEYLSGFAATPLHLVTFLSPGLFERSPLWRPLVWDPFHTSPEEYLGYVGVVPLWLAACALGTGIRRSAAVRALTVVGVATLILGLGPYVPGFSLWCGLPGFSFFRAPARWLLATSLALSLLAALGYDALNAIRRPGRVLVGFVLSGVLLTALVVLAVELALASTGRPGLPSFASFYARALDALPWHEPSVFSRIARDARRTNNEHRVQEALARQGARLSSIPRPVFDEQRSLIYRQELTGSALIALALLGLAPLARRRPFRVGLILLTAVDLGSFGRHRRVDLGPLAPLASQSPVIAGLAHEPAGLRTIDVLRNMPMVAAAAPVAAYRTLDLPALESVTALAGSLPAKGEEQDDVLGAIRATGAGLRIIDPFQVRELERSGVTLPGGMKTVRDPALAGWLLGTDWVKQQGSWASTFRLWNPPGPHARAWLVPLTVPGATAILGDWSGNPRDVLGVLKGARPLDVRATDPEHRELSVTAGTRSLVLLSELADPQWRAVRTRAGGVQPARIERAFGRPDRGAWQAVELPGPGDWELRLTYPGRDVFEGLMVSGLAAAVLAALAFRYGRGSGREKGGGE